MQMTTFENATQQTGDSNRQQKSKQKKPKKPKKQVVSRAAIAKPSNASKPSKPSKPSNVSKPRDPTVAHPEPRTKRQKVFAMMQKSIVGYTEEQFAFFSREKFTVRRDAQYASCLQAGTTVHFKGFASGVDFNDPHNIGMATQLMQRLKAIQPSRIVWDGDGYELDSFTRLILHMHRELGDAVELVAFLRECDQERFSQSWEATGVAVSMYLCPSSLSWPKLGTHALEVTGSEVVVCYGGGGTVADEFAAKPSAEVKFNMFAISRPRPDTGTEQAALVGETNASLQVFTAPMPLTRSNGVHKFIRSTDGGTEQDIKSAPHLVRVHFKTWCVALECDMD